MNNKFLFQDLSEQLSNSGKLKKKDAEEFLRAYFKVIEEALFQGEVVKIQGLGTFKLLKVDARKSVNVSTGAEFEIKEHYKITFLPDAALKELVNIPFSHLEPVDLSNTIKKDIPPIISETITEEVMEKKTNSPKSPGKDLNKGLEPSIDGLPKNPEKKSKKTGSGRGNLFWIFFAVFVGSLVFWAVKSNQAAQKEYEHNLKSAAEYDSIQNEKLLTDQSVNSIQDSLVIEAEISAKLESLAIAEKNGKPGDKAEEAIQSEAIPERTIQHSQKTTDNTDIKQSKAELETPARAESNTSGTSYPTSEIMKQGSTLMQMSLKYYGNKAFWVYIYEANKSAIPNPNNVAIGTKIRIPKPDASIINSNDPNCIAKAKALQSKILSNN